MSTKIVIQCDICFKEIPDNEDWGNFTKNYSINLSSFAPDLGTKKTAFDLCLKCTSIVYDKIVQMVNEQKGKHITRYLDCAEAGKAAEEDMSTFRNALKQSQSEEP